MSFGGAGTGRAGSGIVGSGGSGNVAQNNGVTLGIQSSAAANAGGSVNLGFTAGWLIVLALVLVFYIMKVR